ncbi:MAG: uL15m family ribosomal protein [Candidatus Aenigmatarchaeota archaeon]
MVVRREKKRRRGERTYHGHHKNRKGGGHKGGRGNVSKHKHIFKFLEREDKRGFRYPLRKEYKVINLEDLNYLIEKLIEEGKIDKNNIRINILDYGYEKILGKGNLKFRATIEALKASKKAIEKVKNVGGEIILKS